MLRVNVLDEDGFTHEQHLFPGECLVSSREQALDWLHSNGFAYEGTEREDDRVYDTYESVRNPLFHAILEEV